MQSKCDTKAGNEYGAQHVHVHAGHGVAMRKSSQDNDDQTRREHKSHDTAVLTRLETHLLRIGQPCEDGGTKHTAISEQNRTGTSQQGLFSCNQILATQRVAATLLSSCRPDTRFLSSNCCPDNLLLQLCLSSSMPADAATDHNCTAGTTTGQVLLQVVESRASNCRQADEDVILRWGHETGRAPRIRMAPVACGRLVLLKAIPVHTPARFR